MRGNRHRLLGTLAAAGAAMAILGSCAGGMGKPTVTAKVTDSAFTVVPGTANEGKVKIDIDNNTTANRVLLILRTNDVAKVPLTPDGVIDTSKVSIADTVKEFGPGRYRALSPNLVAGTYIVTAVTAEPSKEEGKPRYKFTPTQAAKLELKSLRGAS